MKPSQLLKEAKKYLAVSMADYYNNDKYTFICLALGRVTDQKPTDETRASLFVTKKHIRQLLNGRPTLDWWLSRTYGIDTHSNRDKLQRTRHAWVDDMIRYFKAKGQ